MHPNRYDPIESNCCDTSFSAFKTRSNSATGAVSDRLVDAAAIPIVVEELGQMIDTAEQASEPFGKLWRVETREERTEIPAGKLIGLNSGRACP